MVLKFRRPFTLLEMLIAISLLALLLSTLLSIYRYIDGMNQDIRRTEQQNFKLLYAQYRLANALPHATSKEKEVKKKKSDDFYFFTTTDSKLGNSSQSLVFTYDNGISTPDFSNTVIGRLFLDSEGRLVLATWPSINRNNSAAPPMRKEVLIEGIESIAFAFYLAPKNEQGNKIVDPEAEKTFGRWYAEWPVEGVKPEEVSLPPMMKLLIRLKGSRLEKGQADLAFAFLLPESEQFIQYTQ